MDKRRWIILIAGFIMIEGLILVSNRVFYSQMQEMEETVRTDHAIFQSSSPQVVQKVRPVSSLIDSRTDPLAPMAKKKPEKIPAPAGGPEKVYETGIQSGILIQ